MGELIRFDLEQGGEVLVEVDEDAFGVEPVSRDGDGLVRASKGLEAALAAIGPAARAVLSSVDGLGLCEKQIQFGVKLNGEVGAVIARSGVEANFQVTLISRDREIGDDHDAPMA